MGGLAHYIEGTGIPTTHISLIREHTETIRPPRALWVPFEFGRPMGEPNDPVFQSRVLLHALQLLKNSRCPVLENFTQESFFPSNSPAGEGVLSQHVACPVNFRPATLPLNNMEEMLSLFMDEVAQMQSWFDLAVIQRGRTTTGVTGMFPKETARFLADFVRDRHQESPIPDTPLPTALRMAAEDLKAYYFEAVTAQPGQPTDSETLGNWFWSDTTAAQVINTVRNICAAIQENEYQLLAKLLLVPKSRLKHFKGTSD